MAEKTIGVKYCNLCSGALGSKQVMKDGKPESVLACMECGTPYEEHPPYAEALPKCRDPECGGKIQFRRGIQACVKCGLPLREGAKPQLNPFEEAEAAQKAKEERFRRGKKPAEAVS